MVFSTCILMQNKSWNDERNLAKVEAGNENLDGQMENHCLKRSWIDERSA